MPYAKIVAAIILTCLIGSTSAIAEQATRSSATAPELFEYTLNERDVPNALRLGNYDEVVFVATWCSASTFLAEMLSAKQQSELSPQSLFRNGPSVGGGSGRKAKQKRIAFILADEWPRIRREYSEQGIYTQEELDVIEAEQIYREKSYWLFDPEKIGIYPGDVYVYPAHPDDAPGLEFYPALYDRGSGRFSLNAGQVLILGERRY